MSQGTIDLKNAFNEIGEPAGYSCQQATLRYTRAHDVEWQVLGFRGTGPKDIVFDVESRNVGAGEDVNAVARETAQKVVDQGAKI